MKNHLTAHLIYKLVILRAHSFMSSEADSSHSCAGAIGTGPETIAAVSLTPCVWLFDSPFSVSPTDIGCDEPVMCLIQLVVAVQLLTMCSHP